MKNDINIKNKGFTIIETLLILFVFVTISIMSFSFLLTTLTSNSKNEVMKEVRQNGSYALSTIERLIISSKNVECSVPPAIPSMQITKVDGTLTTIKCTGEAINSTTSPSDPVFLTSSNDVKVTDCSFVCTNSSGIPETVGIGFSVSQKAVTTKTSETSSMGFSTKVIVRNKID